VGGEEDAVTLCDGLGAIRRRDDAPRVRVAVAAQELAAEASLSA